MADEQDRLRIQREEERRIAREKRMAELKAEREKKMEELARERATSDPMKDPTNRPEAPQLDDGYIRYYSWIGGVTTGSWRLYKEKADSPKAASAEARSEGGATQADFSSSTGANTLAASDSFGSTGSTGSIGSTGGASQTNEQYAQSLGYTFGAPPASLGFQGVLSSTFSEFTSPGVQKSSPIFAYKIVDNGNGTYSLAVLARRDDNSITGGTYGAQYYLDPNSKTYINAASDNAGGAGGTGSTGGSRTTGNTSSTDPATLALIKSLQDQIAKLTANNEQSAADKAAAEAAAKKEKAESAIAVLTDRFSRYGLASLVPKIKELAIGGAGESTITLQLQETEEYRQRFRANQDRIKKGLSVLDPGDYLGLEDDYRQILRAYGLKQFDNDDYVTQFISNDISTTELSNRVATAVQRVQNADPAILTTLRSFYGISDNDLVAYVLDPNQQFQKIERQVAAAEIGAAAKLQGINAGVTVSEQLAAQGVTKAQAQKGYATIADILPTAEKLSDIYGKTLDEYRLGEAEQEVFNTLASAQRKRQKLIQTEIASFSGASGLGKSSLTSQLGGTY